MCGIAGIVRLDGGPIDSRDLVRMSDRLRHRGPDDGGYAFLSGDPRKCRFIRSESGDLPDGGVSAGFAHRRLSIIDVSTRGVQPMSDDSGEVWISYNGEIFNYIELRGELESRGRRFRTSTDTEVLLAAWNEWGPSCLERLNGMWAFAVWDTRRRRLFIARDRFGIKPLYHAVRGGAFVFASEPGAILALDGVSHEPDMRAVADYIVHSRLDCFSWTFFKDISRLDPGACLDIGFDDRTPPEPTVWWRLADTLTEPPKDDDACAGEFLDLFSSAVKLRLRSDVPVGTCLSGGLDSTAVVCVARPWLEPGNQKTFSAVYDASFDEDETEYVDEVVRFADVENYRTRPTAETLIEDLDALIAAQGEPFNSTSQYAQYKVFELTRREGTTVTLDGQGADEELAGYHYLYPVHIAGLIGRGRYGAAMAELAAWRSRSGAALAPSVLSTAAGFLSHRAMIRWANRYDPSRNVGWAKEGLRAAAAGIRTQEPPRFGDRLNERLYELFAVSSLPALLRYEDRNSMAFSIEARLPFMDHRLVSFLFSLPPDMKIRDGWTKYVLRRAVRGVIPETIRTRTDKIGFATPEAAWYRGGMLPYIRSVIDSPTTKNRGLYDTPKLLGLVEANAAGKVDAGRAIWRALNLELWFRAFVD